MQASKLQLEHYYLEELHFALNERYGPEAIENEVPLRAENIDVTVEAGQNPDNELEWFFRLKVALEDKDSKFPFEFTIRLAGFFNISEECAPDAREQLATINAPSLLYGAAREILATTSARSRFISVFLPPIRFFGMTKERSAVASTTKRATKKPVARKK